MQIHLFILTIAGAGGVMGGEGAGGEEVRLRTKSPQRGELESRKKRNFIAALLFIDVSSL